MAVQLLVSVADAAEARAALGGGADVIDAKDPTRGALGAVDPASRSAILTAVGGARPVSAALGDAATGDAATGGAATGRSAATAPLVGLAFAKLGFGPDVDRAAAVPVVTALVRAARGHGCGIVLASYAETIAGLPGAGDARWSGLDADAVLDVAVAVGASGVLLDTADKSGPGLFALLGEIAVADWVRRAHAAGLTAALAGRLGLDDVPRAIAADADIIGVRGAACDGSRTGRVTADRVAALVAAVRAAARAAARPGTRAAAQCPATSA